jgi:hypothetical protein
LAEFRERQRIPFSLLSDLESEVIREYGILNTQVQPGDAFLHGIPYPGVYVVDGDGVVVAKFFHDTYKKRDSPEILIDAAQGRIELAADAPQVGGGDDQVRITAAVHGGRGTIRQGIRRKLVVRFEIGEGFHLYGEPVPEGMVPVRVEVEGPPGLVVEDPILPPTSPLRLPNVDVELPVWSGTVDIALPFYPTGELASEVRPLDTERVSLEVTVRYQACDDRVCLLPRTEKLVLDVPLDVVDVPALAMHQGHGQREAGYDSTRHAVRLMLRKVRRHPLGLLRFLWKSIALELAARRRRA